METIQFDLQHPPTITTPLTACIGYFDGLHIGHQRLIQHVLRIAKQNGTRPALITFEPDPWVVLKHINEEIPHLTPMQHRKEIGAQLGIEVWIILSFDETMAHIGYEAFHQQVLQPLMLHTLVCGYDFHYAIHGKGSIDTLRQQQLFHIDVVEEVREEQQKISSSHIEELIKTGDMEHSAHLLGRFYELRGTIGRGRQVGGKHGFATANLELHDAYCIPLKGVYIGCVYVLDAWHPAIINIGHNPTYNYQQQQSIEAHLLHFHAMIYDASVRFQFHKRIRGEQKFADIAALSAQLHADVETAELYFKKKGELSLCD